MTWNFDIAAAPRGRTEKRTYIAKGVEVSRDVFVADRIIAAASDGKTVTVSEWLPQAERWNMFAKEHPPVAWMAWPEHPLPLHEGSGE